MAREGKLGVAVASGACWATICGSESVIGGGKESGLASVRARSERGQCDRLAEGSHQAEREHESGVSQGVGGSGSHVSQSRWRAGAYQSKVVFRATDSGTYSRSLTSEYGNETPLLFRTSWKSCVFEDSVNPVSRGAV